MQQSVAQWSLSTTPYQRHSAGQLVRMAMPQEKQTQVVCCLVGGSVAAASATHHKPPIGRMLHVCSITRIESEQRELRTAPVRAPKLPLSRRPLGRLVHPAISSSTYPGFRPACARRHAHDAGHSECCGQQAQACVLRASRCHGSWRHGGGQQQVGEGGLLGGLERRRRRRLWAGCAGQKMPLLLVRFCNHAAPISPIPTCHHQQGGAAAAAAATHVSGSSGCTAWFGA